MATYQVSPSEQFTFNRAHEWPKWIRRFKRFRSASGLFEKNPEVPRWFIPWVTMPMIFSDRLDWLKTRRKSTLWKFKSHFVKRRNTIIEWAKFNKRRKSLWGRFCHRSVCLDWALFLWNDTNPRYTQWNDTWSFSHGPTRCQVVREAPIGCGTNTRQSCESS